MSSDRTLLPGNVKVINFDDSEGSGTDDDGGGSSVLQKDLRMVKSILVTPLNLLLLFFPLGIASGFFQWGESWTFLLNFIALVPIAGLMGTATESIALHTGDLIGGLINATFGNAIEMIVTWEALHRAQDPDHVYMVKVVQGSLLGSVLSNLLLVLGTAFLIGGVWFSEQGFNIKGATSNVSCLLLSSIALILPTMYSYTNDVSEADVLMASRISAIVLTGMYVLFLIFQLKTHVHLFQTAGEEEEEPEMSALCSGLVLFVIVGAAIMSSEYLVDSLKGFTKNAGVPTTFVGVILLPFVGNAVEHTTAVTSAVKNKMDLAIGIAVGSSTQIALFVVPFSVLLAWWMNVPLSLNFHMFDAGVMILSVLIVGAVVADGYSNWLEGAMLVATYILCGIMFFMNADNSGRQEL